MSKGKITIVFLIIFGLLVLAMPVSNFFLQRQTIEVTSGIPEFKPVSKIMQNKCVDCHTPGMVSEPFYGKLPGASQLIQADIDGAQQQIIFSKEHLKGEKQFSKLELVRIQTVVQNNEMPILPYKMLHWDAGLTNEDREAFLVWIQAQMKTATNAPSPVEVPNEQTPVK
ncbi:MAG: heme-binding domain-containing protein [Candidatus Melainabacteria bacterium]|nr:heme-binding domain-containing protein [Candidatus Melainabacteria bacterium]